MCLKIQSASSFGVQWREKQKGGRVVLWKIEKVISLGFFFFLACALTCPLLTNHTGAPKARPLGLPSLEGCREVFLADHSGSLGTFSNFQNVPSDRRFHQVVMKRKKRLLKTEDSQNENQAFLYQNHHPWDKPSFKKTKKKPYNWNVSSTSQSSSNLDICWDLKLPQPNDFIPRVLSNHREI